MEMSGCLCVKGIQGEKAPTDRGFSKQVSRGEEAFFLCADFIVGETRGLWGGTNKKQGSCSRWDGAGVGGGSRVLSQRQRQRTKIDQLLT